ncbi:MAG: hypothetical protein JXB32_18845 [Deltaproteobacteria bacterium]|nr:hypothetical protein [Deltaproteobacteria bacterium]
MSEAHPFDVTTFRARLDEVVNRTPARGSLVAAARQVCMSLSTVALRGKSEPIRLWGAADPDPAA